MENLEEIRKLLDDHQMYHSELQMDCFITARAGGTVYGCYKQALRELFKRYRGVRELCAEKELMEIDIDELAFQAPEDCFEARRRRVRLAQKRSRLEDLERNLLDTQRELERFLQQARELKKQVGELTPARRRELDAEMWHHRLKSMVAVEFVTVGHLNANTIECIQSLPPEQRRRLLEDMNSGESIKQLIDWFYNYQPVNLLASPAEGGEERERREA